MSESNVGDWNHIRGLSEDSLCSGTLDASVVAEPKGCLDIFHQMASRLVLRLLPAQILHRNVEVFPYQCLRTAVVGKTDKGL